MVIELAFLFCWGVVGPDIVRLQCLRAFAFFFFFSGKVAIIIERVTVYRIWVGRRLSRF